MIAFFLDLPCQVLHMCERTLDTALGELLRDILAECSEPVLSLRRAAVLAVRCAQRRDEWLTSAEVRHKGRNR